jgi:hypothetical protein
MAVKTVKAEDIDVETFDEFMQGLPDEQKEIPAPRTDVHDPIVPSNILGNDLTVTLVNLRYPNEVVFIPQQRLLETGVIEPYFSVQDYASFTDGVMVCSEKVAENVMSQCPYVRREPATGEVSVYEPSGFATRNPATFAEHVTRYNEDFMS